MGSWGLWLSVIRFVRAIHLSGMWVTRRSGGRSGGKMQRHHLFEGGGVVLAAGANQRAVARERREGEGLATRLCCKVLRSLEQIDGGELLILLMRG